MTLQGIDIASYQAGIDLTVVPCDFVIIKATQGTGYTNPDCVRAYEQAKGAGKLLGVYHYINGVGAVTEANFFVDSVKNWVGEAMLCLDWEKEQNSAWGNESYLDAVVAQIIARTGIPPMIYSMQSRYSAVAEVANKYNCGLWIAQYATVTGTTGYQDTPWNEGKYTCAIRQYASTGRLAGYSKNLDLNKFYGDSNAWNAYVKGGSDSTPTPEPSAPVDNTPSGTTLELAVRVMANEFGVGDARKSALGSRYDEVQDFVEHIFTASTATLAEEVKADKYGSGNQRKAVLGSRYSAVQAIINGNSRKSNATIAREVVRGSWGNDPQRSVKLRAAGYDPKVIQSLVNKLM